MHLEGAAELRGTASRIVDGIPKYLPVPVRDPLIVFMDYFALLMLVTIFISVTGVGQTRIFPSGSRIRRLMARVRVI